MGALSLVSLLPLAVALILIVAPKGWTLCKLDAARDWLTRARIVAAAYHSASADQGTGAGEPRASAREKLG